MPNIKQYIFTVIAAMSLALHAILSIFSHTFLLIFLVGMAADSLLPASEKMALALESHLSLEGPPCSIPLVQTLTNE